MLGHGGNADEALETQTNGSNVDRLQLREERLLIDKQPVASGEARIGKEVVSEQKSIDVPVFHEELSIQRQPVSEGATAATTPIGEEGEEIRIPLTEERVDVQKRTVVTEQVQIGKRKVEGNPSTSAIRCATKSCALTTTAAALRFRNLVGNGKWVS